MISFDLDMTLLDHKTGRITPSALDAIERLKAHHKIILATGRDMDNYYSRMYLDIVSPDAVVHMNGTKVTAGDQLLYEHLFDKDLLERLLTYCEREGFGIGMTEGDLDYYIHPEVIKANDIRAFGSCGRQFQDPWDMMHKKIRTLAMIGSEKQIAQVGQAFPQLKLPLFASRRGADVIEHGYSKADGLKHLAKYFNEPENLAETVAFGDSMNDLEVIKAAGLGIAMGNSVPELKAAADYVTAGIDEDGIWQACEKFGLFENTRGRWAAGGLL